MKEITSREEWLEYQQEQEPYLEWLAKQPKPEIEQIPQWQPDESVEAIEISPEKAEENLKHLRRLKIINAIRERYSIEDEIAILRQRDTKPEEYAEYNAFVESVKVGVQNGD